MYLDMGSLAGVGLTSPGISNGHKARAMSRLEGGTFLCLNACCLLLYMSTCVCACVCACFRERLTVGESLLDIKREGGSLWLEKSLLALGFPLFLFPLFFPFPFLFL